VKASDTLTVRAKRGSEFGVTIFHWSLRQWNSNRRAKQFIMTGYVMRVLRSIVWGWLEERVRIGGNKFILR